MDGRYDYYSTFRFYDERGRRLSIFGRVLEGGKEMVIVIFTCSKKDDFTKHVGRSLFEFWREGKAEDFVKPLVLQVPIQDNKPKWTFINWCNKNYYKMRTLILPIIYTALINEEMDRVVKTINTEQIAIDYSCTEDKEYGV